MASVNAVSDSSSYDFAAGGLKKVPEETGSDPQRKGGTKKLTADDERLAAKLRDVDRQVRAHEAAHTAAGGGLVKGGATYSYATGPDGKRYAVAGEVRIDTSAVSGKPEATILKMEQVRRAALAPADPSAQDRSVAADAAATEANARKELAAEHASEAQAKTDPRVAQYAQRTQKSLLGKVYL